MVELMLHECTHQIIHERVKGDFTKIDGATAPNFWVHEGIAEFYGMHTFDQSLLRLYEYGLVTYQDAIAHSTNPADLKLSVQNKGLKSA